jgi:hypothetical protein|tara:strand:+ start:923 stop:1108 length:186 start_codon:yes stop_codon:yes gene_type:complete
MNGPKAAALKVAAEELEMNLRRESALFGLFVIVLILKVYINRRLQAEYCRNEKILTYFKGY